MSDRDRIAAVVHGVTADHCRDLESETECYSIADALIAAGVTIPDVMDDDYIPPCCRPGGRCNRV